MSESGLLLVAPRAGWWRGAASEDEEDVRAERQAARMRARWDARHTLTELLGLIYRDTTMLPVPGGGVLGPARGPDGVVLRWWLWAPAKLVLVDVFRRQPAREEVAARSAFAQQHGLRYGAVLPDKRFTVAALKEWLG